MLNQNSKIIFYEIRNGWYFHYIKINTYSVLKYQNEKFIE